MQLLSFAIPSSVALALGALTLWHAALITRGETSIERHINRKERQRLQKKGKVSTARGAGGLAGAEPGMTCVCLASRSSGTPTVTAAGITGRCSWAWTCQGKALGKPFAPEGRWWLMGAWGCWDIRALLGQSRMVSIPAVRCSGLCKVQRTWAPATVWLLSPARWQALAGPAPGEPCLRSLAVAAAQGHGLQALARLCRAEKQQHSSFLFFWWLDLMILGVFSNLNESMILRFCCGLPPLPTGTGSPASCCRPLTGPTGRA